MVAYGFKKFFSPQIEDGTKRQTVRADRARHVRPGEAIQLYEGMRTKHCRRIIADQVCIAIVPVRIRLNELLNEIIASIEVDGIILHRDAIEEFACLDGFHPDRLQVKLNGRVAKTARENMGLFWRANHPGVDRFDGRLILWKPEG